MLYIWTVTVMSASCITVWRTLQMANAMDATTSHGVRCGASIMAVSGLWGVLSPISGDMHSFTEPSAWLLLGLGVYMLSERRRPMVRR